MKSFKQFLNAKTLTPKQIAQKNHMPLGKITSALKSGMNVEREHTKHKGVAREIALDHLGERPDYYQRLKKVENGN